MLSRDWKVLASALVGDRSRVAEATLLFYLLCTNVYLFHDTSIQSDCEGFSVELST